MLLTIYIIATYILFMCLFRDDITQVEHLVVVALFCGLLIALSHLEDVVKYMQCRIDHMLGFDGDQQNEQSRSHIQSQSQYMASLLWAINVVWVWVQKDYESSQLRRAIRKGKRHIRTKYFLLYSKINDFHKA